MQTTITRTDLADFLDEWSGTSETRSAVRSAILAMAEASLIVRQNIADGPVMSEADNYGSGEVNGAATTQMYLTARDAIVAALADTSIAAIATPDLDSPIVIDDGRPLLAAIDPLNGSVNSDAHAAVGTIFSLLPRRSRGDELEQPEAFCQDGDRQMAAGFIVYGPNTSIVLTVRDGTHIFKYDNAAERYVLTSEHVAIPKMAREYAINASNYRHWDEAIRSYVDDCLKGVEGVRGCDFNMRWIGSLVFEVYRIFNRGGIYLYPADRRPGYAQGRLELIFEANPIALLVEQAGGVATTGRNPILDITPKSLHQRVPIITGSFAEVDYVRRLYSHPQAEGERSPLFGRRGLFRV